MSNNDWIGNSKCVYSTTGSSNHSKFERAQNDFYATDPKSVKLLIQNETFVNTILEPACGMGHISNELIKNGFNVYSSDIDDRGYGTPFVDFLSPQFTFKFDGDFDIITNPPYRTALEFCYKGMEILKPKRKLALFLRLQFLESQKRRIFFDSCPPKTIYVASSRLNCAKNGDFSKKESSAIAYAWFVWEKGFNGNPIVKWIN